MKGKANHLPATLAVFLLIGTFSMNLYAKLTACLTPGGTLVNVVQGENPPGHTCTKNQISVVFGGDTDTEKFIFASSFITNGAMGGIRGANQVCQDEADVEGLPGLYKAWLSTAASGPRATFKQAQVPYILPGSFEVIADDWNDLVDGNLAHQINEHANGDAVVSYYGFWTGTKYDGSPSLGNTNTNTIIYETCVDWTSNDRWAYGVNGYLQTNYRWTFGGEARCDYLRRIICVQQ